MLYILVGEDHSLIKSKINSIRKKINILKENMHFFDLNNIKLHDALISAANSNLFADKKLNIFYNSNFLSNSNKKNNYKNNSILNVFKNDNNNIIFITNKINYKNNNILNKYIIKNSLEIKINAFNFDFIQNAITNYAIKNNISINKEDITFFIENHPKSIDIIINEFKKLSLVTKNITKSDILNNINRFYDVTPFDLLNYLMENQTIKFINEYNIYLKQKDDYYALNLLFSSNFILLRNIKILSNANLDSYKISKLLNVNIYRINILMNYINNYSLKKLNKIILIFSDINYKILKGFINNNLKYKIYMLKLFYGDF